MTMHLVQMQNFRIHSLGKAILIFDNNTSGAFRHVKRHPQLESAHAYFVG